jgi:MYXO-CTERM domain-containing protein
MTCCTPFRDGSLPLFATGLAGLGLLGWRRKKIGNLSA